MPQHSGLYPKLAKVPRDYEQGSEDCPGRYRLQSVSLGAGSDQFVVQELGTAPHKVGLHLFHHTS